MGVARGILIRSSHLFSSRRHGESLWVLIVALSFAVPTSSHRADMVNRCGYCSWHSASHFPTSSHRADMVNRRAQSKWIVSTGAEAFWLKCARGVRARRRQADSLSLRGWQPRSHAIAGAPVDKQPSPCQKLVPPVEASDGCAIAHGRVGQRI